MRRREAGWGALRARIDEGQVQVLETSMFDDAALQTPTKQQDGEDGAANARNPLEAWLEEHGNPLVYMLIPGGLTLSRVLNLNLENDEDLDQELRLQAESHLLGGAPAHRVGMTTLPLRAHGQNQGIVITWPEASQPLLPPIEDPILCIPETAALLAMVPTTPLSSPILHSEHRTGGLALVLETEDGLVVRSTREQSEDGATWRAEIEKAVVETAITSGVPLDQIQALKDTISTALHGREELLLLPEEGRLALDEVVEGSGDESWWQEWGLAVGAVLACKGALQPLTNLRARKETESTGVVGEIMRTLSDTRTTVAILVAAIFAITIIPMFAAWLRLAITESKIADQAELKAVLASSTQQKGVYNEVAKRSWPITKLLGDVANCIPLGIEAETIIIQEGDSIILRGSAGEYQGTSPTDLLQNMMNQFKATNIFTDFNSSVEPIDSGGRVEFSFTFRVKNAYRQVRSFENDFAKISHARLRYPHAFEDEEETDDSEPSSSSTTALATESAPSTTTSEDSDAPATTPPSRTVASRSDTNSSRSGNSRASSSSNSDAPPGVGRSSLLGPRGGSSATRSRSSSSSRAGGSLQGTSGATRRSQSTGARGSGGPAPVPESPTDSELRAMSLSEAKDLLTRVAQARQRDDLDDATKATLKQDFDRILEQMRIKQASEGGS